MLCRLFVTMKFLKTIYSLLLRSCLLTVQLRPLDWSTEKEMSHAAMHSNSTGEQSPGEACAIVDVESGKVCEQALWASASVQAFFPYC